MSPVERETQKRESDREKVRSTKEIAEQQFSIQACSVAPMHDVAGPLEHFKEILKISCEGLRETETERE